LAFATPSGSGISGRRSFKRFLEQSPPDHWTIWKPAQTRDILKRFGFTLKRVFVSGHHPERFPLAERFLPGKERSSWEQGNQGMVYGLFRWISRIFHLGDTFEVYAVKRPVFGIATGER
ncbi:MAG: hypothetical protein LBQ30_00200, partial [Treponema sp.]|nr:hypothetical protein [Treponema sp.]